LSNIDNIEQFKNKIISGDLFPKHLGIEFLEIKPGYASVSLEIKEHMVNFHGITHGGIVLTLADTALGIASNSYGRPAVALNFSMNFIKKTVPGQTITATAEEINRTYRTALYRVTVRDESGEQIAVVDGLVYVKDKK
jgi:acyl-CoA thioesterase